jgi:hypothetical protein
MELINYQLVKNGLRLIHIIMIFSAYLIIKKGKENDKRFTQSIHNKPSSRA